MSASLPERGRTTGKQLSYFNLEWPGQGVIIALGWPGDWAAQFTRDEGMGLRVQRRPGAHPLQIVAGGRSQGSTGSGAILRP